MRQTRPRSVEQEDCPKCQAPKGTKCRNYLKKGKAPCTLNILLPIKDKKGKRKRVKVWRQQTFWPMDDWPGVRLHG